MEGFKEFQGKDLDDAIEEACGYFDTAREKLEIEIVQDAKSGIFGIVGARKAKVRARRVQLREAVESILGKKNGERGNRGNGVEQRKSRGSARKGGPETESPVASVAAAVEAGASETEAPMCEAGPQSMPGTMPESVQITTPQENSGQENSEQECSAQEREEERGAIRSARPEKQRASGEGRGRDRGGEEPVRGRREARSEVREAVRPVRAEAPADGLDDDLDEAAEDLPVTPVEQLDPARLEALVQEAVRELVRPIVGTELRLEVSVGGGRVQVCVDCDEDSGLLIGREGQTLAALQYLISRVVSRGMNAAVRVQLDAGEYRRRQDEKLREMALALAEKVRQSGRSYSTRPLSSYHRRIVHVCLQDAADVQTRSTGDGPMKRVVVMRRKPEKA